jgi:hypothetical protein
LGDRRVKQTAALKRPVKLLLWLKGCGNLERDWVFVEHLAGHVLVVNRVY